MGSKRKPARALFITLRVWGGRITFSAIVVKSTTDIEQFFLLNFLNKILTEDTAIGEVACD